MRELTPGEMLQLREFLTIETVNVTNLKMAKSLISEDRLKDACYTGINACEGRIRAIQQFIEENGIAEVQGVQ